MKELSIEEKAKAYDEALKVAEKYHNGTLKDVMETVFPALIESEDERIRKEIISYLKRRKMASSVPAAIGYWIAWLEKQGKQKHKIQPKFKIGDIIRFKGNETLKGEAETHKIVRYDNELYVFDDGTTDLFCEQDLYELVERKLAPWSEEDKMQLDAAIHLVNSTGHIETANWLKSLRPQSHWKPSEEQLIALKCAITTADEKWVCMNTKDLESLYEQLMKLREE